MIGPFLNQLVRACIAIVSVIESRDDGTPEQSYFAAADKLRALPHTRRHYDLDLLPRGKIWSKGQKCGAP